MSVRFRRIGTPKTSRMPHERVGSITSRSMPTPEPPARDMPYPRSFKRTSKPSRKEFLEDVWIVRPESIRELVDVEHVGRESLRANADAKPWTIRVRIKDHKADSEEH